MTSRRKANHVRAETVRSVGVKALVGAALLSGALAPWPSQRVTNAQQAARDVPLRLAQRWDELSPRERSRALDNYRRFQKLPPEKKRDLEERYDRWRHLPSEEQERIRQNYRRYRGMNSDEKEEFGRKYKYWRSRPRD
jgi:hypothetical protein